MDRSGSGVSSQLRRKPVPSSQPLPSPSSTPSLPAYRVDLREHAASQCGVQTASPVIDTKPGSYHARDLEYRPALPPRIPTPVSAKLPRSTASTSQQQGVEGNWTDQHGAQSNNLTINTTTTRKAWDSYHDDRPALPPRIPTPQPDQHLGSRSGKSPAPSPRGSPHFGSYAASQEALTPPCDPPPYSVYNPNTQNLHPSPPSSTLPSTPTTPTAPSTSSTRWQSALDSTKDFALNLLPQNIASTKHYTILLHSSPLILYRGPTTSLTMTIFSSPKYPLPRPEHRLLYLQPRGYSGDTGSRLKSLVGATEDWIDVTPAVRADSRDVDPSLVRRWDKDIARTTKRLGKQFKEGKVHVARETHTIRIPAVAEDGYFRVVVCHKEEGQKRKTLCTGPLVRIASLSADSSVFRGAKLRTLPLEAGVSVASMMASKYVTTVTGPVVGAVQNQVNRVRPGALVSTAGALAYDAVLADKVDGRTGATRDATYQPYSVEHGRGTDVVGPDEGPERPFPVRFQGKVVPGTGRGTERLGIPTANLAEVPEETKDHLKGVYFGWASICGTSGAEPDWHEAIISVGPSPFAPPAIVHKTVVAVHMLHSFDDEAKFYGAKMQVVIMGFLRPAQAPGTPVEQILDATSQDLWVTMASLGRESWGPHAAAERVRTLRTARTFSDRISQTKDRVQTGIDRIPAHWVGVRTAGAEVRDQMHGNGGYWFSR